MQTFIVTVKEIHASQYRVKAVDEEDAKNQVFQVGEHLSTEFQDTLMDDSSNVVDGRYLIKST